ncbi:MAG: PhzF family phenazine biosynthesis protein [Burkholderiaceae bacterium]
MRLPYLTCDVFTRERFGGNPLAVFPRADGLTTDQMQRIAREFNYSETTFVLPAQQKGHTKRVRIFTPTREVPFAGHPNIGTACCLFDEGLLPDGPASSLRSDIDPLDIVFEEEAGLVAISVARSDGLTHARLTAPAPITLGETRSAEMIAAALALSPDDIVTAAHEPRLASVGLPFIVAQLKDAQTLARCKINLPGFDAIHDSGVMPDLYVYCRPGGERTLQCRVFAPLDGVPEDPATGSANCAAVGLLASLDAAQDGQLDYRITQGIEMGRPSELAASVIKRAGNVESVMIGGASVVMMRGEIEL